MAEQFTHASVLLNEAVEALALRSDGVYIDGTFGRGGHSRRILEALGPKARLIAIDQDPEAIREAEALRQEDPRVEVFKSNFVALNEVARMAGLEQGVDGVLLDLGVSSPQLDDAARGFSFMREGPLDMRMDPESGISAADWLASASDNEIAKVLRDYGEERFAWRIAQRIVSAREETPIRTTKELADLIEAAVPKREPGKHPATRSFQAIRIYLNRELDVITEVLPKALDLLRIGGRLVVISFHSLEDRIVKRFFRDEARGPQFPKGVPVTADMVQPRVRLVGKAVRAGRQELEGNVRARSAVMRVVERLV